MTKRRAMHAKNSVSDAASGLQDVIDTAEELLDNVKDQQGAAMDSLREKLSDTMSDARQRLRNLEVPQTLSKAYDSSVDAIRSDPWRAVAIGALAALAITFLIRATSED